MNSEFWKDMDLPENSDIHQLERRFLEIIKDRIQTVAENFDEAEVTAEETWLRAFHQNFFLAVLHWVNTEARRKKKTKNHPEALKLKKKAKSAVQDLQKNITEFSTVYMHISRYVTLLRDEIRQEETRLGSAADKNMKWTSDTGVAIRRYKKRKNEILKDIERFEVIRPLLEKLDVDITSLQSALSNMVGADQAKQTVRRFVSSLRTVNLTRANKIFAEIRETKKKFGADQGKFDKNLQTVSTLAKRTISRIKDNEEALQTKEGKIYLRPFEIDMIMKSYAQEMKKIRSFLLKYHLPYMQYKVDSLFHLKDKLLVVGTLDSLMTLYKKLMIGLAEPIADIKGVRIYESEVLERINYLLNTQFREIPKIKKRAENIVREFRQSQQDVKTLKTLSDDTETAASGGEGSGSGESGRSTDEDTVSSSGTR